MFLRSSPETSQTIRFCDYLAADSCARIARFPVLTPEEPQVGAGLVNRLETVSLPSPRQPSAVLPFAGQLLKAPSNSTSGQLAIDVSKRFRLEVNSPKWSTAAVLQEVRNRMVPERIPPAADTAHCLDRKVDSGSVALFCYLFHPR